MLKKLIIVSGILMVSHFVQAQTEKNAQVSLFGLFHFSNPDLDAVKIKQIDVTTDENQDYLIRLSNNIAEKFKPTEILLECEKNQQNKTNTEYQKYLKNDFILPINETYQIGFRVAKAAKIKMLTCYDEREIQWEADNLMKVMPDKAPKIQIRFDANIKEITAQFKEMHSTKPLQDILININKKESDDANKSIYIATNSVGAGTSFEGADAAASWWHRNFRMYANIQKVALPNSRVLVIGGQGHTAILKDFSNLDDEIDTVDIKTFL